MVNGLNPVWIDSADGVRSVAGACDRAGRFAVDTEADSLHSYFHKVCLVQVTADRAHFLIDPLALEKTALEPLWRVVGDPDIPVVMHGSDYDIRVLDRDYSARVAGLEDTQIMAQLLGEKRTGLGALLEQELGITLDKRFQRADWGKRPLPPPYRDYAAADTAFIEELAARLRGRLEVLGRWSWAVEEFGKLEQVRHTTVEPDEYAFEKVKGSRALRGSARDRMFSLFAWRERRAQEADIPPFKILGGPPMLDLAANPVLEIREMARVQGLGHRFVRRWGRNVMKCLENPDQAPAHRRGPRGESLTPEVRSRLKALLAARDEIAEEAGLEPGLVCSKALATAVASQNGVGLSSAEMQEAGLVGWRRELLEEPFRAVLTPGL